MYLLQDRFYRHKCYTTLSLSSTATYLCQCFNMSFVFFPAVKDMNHNTSPQGSPAEQCVICTLTAAVYFRKEG